LVDFGLASAIVPGTPVAERPSRWRRAYAAAWPWLWPLLPFAFGSPQRLDAATVNRMEEGFQGLEGTPGYMAPELWAVPPVAGPHSDVYAAGCTLYELLVNARPFTGRREACSRAVTRRIGTLGRGEEP